MDVQLTADAPATSFRPWRPADGAVFDRSFAFDTETTLIDRQRPWIAPAYVLGAVSDGQSGYFVQPRDVADFLSLHGAWGMVFHNAPFDLAVIQRVAPKNDVYWYVEENLVHDTQLLHRLWRLATAGDAAAGKGQSSLDACAVEHLGVILQKEVLDADGNDVRTGFDKYLRRPPQEIPEIYLRYLATDVLATVAVFDLLWTKISDLLQTSAGEWGYVSDQWQDACVSRYGLLSHHLQLKASIVLREITANGLCVDPSRRAALEDHLRQRSDSLREVLRGFGYLPGEPSATKALQSILREISYRHPDVDLPRTAVRDDIKTSEEGLAPLKGVEPFVDALLEYRSVEKMLNSFVSKLGRPKVHPQFQPLVRSGRTSSFGDLNSQNLPRDDRIRSCFVASPGRVFLTADYVTLELATLAGAVENQFGWPSEMGSAINAGHDLHRLVAAEVFGKNPEEVTKEERQKAKAINFGKPGGMGAAALRQYAKASYGADLSEAEARDISDAWMRRFPEMETFLKAGSDVAARIAARLQLTPATYYDVTGSDRFLKYASAPESPLAVLGGMLLKTIGNKRPATKSGRTYSQAEQDYFWEQLHPFANEFVPETRAAILACQPSWELRREVAKFFDRAGVFTLTGRLRAGASYTERHNTIFQGLAADGAKEALWRLWRAGFKIVNFVHDEVVLEVPASSNLALEEGVVRRLMIDSMQSVVPGVRIDVEAVVSSCWSKAATRRLDAGGKLIPWNAVA